MRPWITRSWDRDELRLNKSCQDRDFLRVSLIFDLIQVLHKCDLFLIVKFTHSVVTWKYSLPKLYWAVLAANTKNQDYLLISFENKSQYDVSSLLFSIISQPLCFLVLWNIGRNIPGVWSHTEIHNVLDSLLQEIEMVLQSQF